MKMSKMKTKWKEQKSEEIKIKITEENKQKVKLKKEIIFQFSATVHVYFSPFNLSELILQY